MTHLSRWSIVIVALGLHMACAAQSQAALQKLVDRYTLEQVELMYDRTHYRYVSMLLYYSRSFEVFDNGAFRPATEAEIASVDLLQYDALRQEKQSVIVHDAVLGRDLKLLGRGEFEALVWAELNEEDRAAYTAYKDAAVGTGFKREH